MNGNTGKALLLVAAMSLLAGGCSMPGEAKTQGTTVVINDDVKLESTLADGSLDVERQPDIEVVKRISHAPFDQPINKDVVTYNENGLLYSLDLSQGTEKKVADREAFMVSENGKWALSYDNKAQEVYAHNLLNGDKKLLENAGPDEILFVDEDIFYYHYKKEMIVRFDPEINQSQTWGMSRFQDYVLNYIEKENDVYYIVASSEKDGYGIYRLQEDGTIENVFSFQGEGKEMSNFSRLQDGSFLFEGMIDSELGIFYWDKQTKNVKKLLAGGEDEEGKWNSTYKLSPDESKILYDTPVQVGGEYRSNVYMAELVDGKLVNSTRIMENVDKYGVISYSGGWSADSKTAYVKTSLGKEDVVGNIAVFQVKE